MKALATQTFMQLEHTIMDQKYTFVFFYSSCKKKKHRLYIYSIKHGLSKWKHLVQTEMTTTVTAEYSGCDKISRCEVKISRLHVVSDYSVYLSTCSLDYVY